MSSRGVAKSRLARIYKRYKNRSGQAMVRYVVTILRQDGNPARIYTEDGALLDSTGRTNTNGNGLLDVYVLANATYNILISHPITEAVLLTDEGVSPSLNPVLAVANLDSAELLAVRSVISPITQTTATSLTTEFVKTDGKLTRINYPDGTYKLFNYNLQGALAYIDFVSTSQVKRKTFVRDAQGSLSQIVETTL